MTRRKPSLGWGVYPKPEYKPPTDYVRAAGQNEFHWPPHWRAVIYRIEQVFLREHANRVYRVTPKNPEFAQYLQAEVWRSDDKEAGRIPPMYLDPVVFETVEEMDRWAQLCARLDK